MRKIRIIFFIFLILILLTMTMNALSTSIEKENQYNATILQLENWLETYDKPIEELEQIIASFDDLQKYKMSKELCYYSNVLLKAIQENFDFDFQFWISMLEQNESFQNYILNDINSLSILSVPEIINYVKGRESEYNGDITAAIRYYRESINFYDASNRYELLTLNEYASKYARAKEMMNNNDLVGAYYLLKELNGYDDSALRMEYIVKVLGYNPDEGTPVPIQTLTPKVTERVTPTATPDTKDMIPTLSQTYPGINAKLIMHEGRWYSKYGPGEEYADASGGYKTDLQHYNKLTIYFCENDWVLTDIFYSSASERYVYFSKNAINYSKNIPQICELDYYEGETNQDIIPLWGPDSSFNQNKECSITSNTKVKIFFKENDYAYAEFSCSLGMVRMWLPMDCITFK